jgi:hypothetical protein
VDLFGAAANAQNGPRTEFVQLEPPNLVDSRHRDEQRAPDERHVPWRRQRAGAHALARAELIARAGECA